MLKLLTLTACQSLAETISEAQEESFHKAYFRERATKYDLNAKTNSEEKLQGDLKFAIVIVDMQELFLAKVTPGESFEMLREQKKVLQIAQEQDIPVLVFEYENNGPTIPTLKEYIEAVPRHKYFTKDEDDGFYPISD